MTEKAKATSLKDLLEDEEYVIGALMKLYSLQTMDEQMMQGTVHQNDVGFNALDAEFLTSLAHQYKSKGYLTDRQIYACRKAIIKYRRQLEQFGFEPMPNKKVEKIERKSDVTPRRASIIQFQKDKSPGIKITFPYDPKDVDRVKTLEGRRFHSDGKPK